MDAFDEGVGNGLAGFRGLFRLGGGLVEALASPLDRGEDPARPCKNVHCVGRAARDSLHCIKL